MQRNTFRDIINRAANKRSNKLLRKERKTNKNKKNNKKHKGEVLVRTGGKQQQLRTIKDLRISKD